MPRRFSGVITALVTPFKRGEVDRASFRRLLKHQLDSGVEGFVVNGTTGESPTLTADEVRTLYLDARDIVSNAVPILVGTGSNCTKRTMEQTAEVARWGADGALVVTPYYNRPPQRGIIAHYKTVCAGSGLPVIAYNVPSRTAVYIEADTLVELSKIGNLVGIKEASGKMDLLRECRGRVDKDFLFTSGDDDSCVEFNSLGGDGVISVISHLIAADLKKALAKAKTEAVSHGAQSEFQQRFGELLRSVYSETNPIGVKAALYRLGIIDSMEVRLPLVEMGSDKLRSLDAALAELKLRRQ